MMSSDQVCISSLLPFPLITHLNNFSPSISLWLTLPSHRLFFKVLSIMVWWHSLLKMNAYDPPILFLSQENLSVFFEPYLTIGNMATCNALFLFNCKCLSCHSLLSAMLFYEVCKFAFYFNPKKKEMSISLSLFWEITQGCSKSKSPFSEITSQCELWKKRENFPLKAK